MSSIEELRNKMSVLNAEVTKISGMRNQNLGKKETLERQCQEMVASYKSKFGVELTVETVSAELDKVVAEKEKEVELLSSVIGALAAGDYDRANAIIAGSSPVVSEETASVADAFANQIDIEEKIAEVVANKAVTAPSIVPFVVEPPVQTTKPITVVEEAIFMPQPMALVTAQPMEFDDSEESEVEEPVEIIEPVEMPIHLAAPPKISIESAFGDFVAPPPAFSIPAAPKNVQTVTKPSTPASNGLDDFKAKFKLPALDVAEDADVSPVTASKPTSFGEIVGGSFFNN